MPWTVTLELRKNTKSGSAIQKVLASRFGKNYKGPEPSKFRNGPDHLVRVSVDLEWQGDGSDQETTFVKRYSQLVEPLTLALAACLRDAGVIIVRTEIDGHRPSPGDRVEFTFADEDHYFTYYTRETESGKKQLRKQRRDKATPIEIRPLWDVLAKADEENPLNNF